MPPVMFGLLSALCWGTSDFVARHAGRALGSLPALTGATAAGLLAMAAWLLATGRPLPPLAALDIWLLLAGLCLAGSLAVFYEALRRGPLALVVPLTGSYPAWALLIAVAAQGVRPSLAAWASMLTIMSGVAMVARFAHPDGDAIADRKRLRATMIAALLAGMMFGVAVALVQQSFKGGHDPVTVTWHLRVVALVALVPVLFTIPWPRRVSPGWAAVLLGQGTLDTLGYLALFAAGPDLAGAEATVASSAFGVVTVLLALILLRERPSPPQWSGMGLVFGGVMVLGGLG
ncbi:MAG: DMT family transporter [Alphaproteobacteria bacterium]|nr:DMT family transporter [Alphaproteobacteria bacterium]